MLKPGFGVPHAPPIDYVHGQTSQGWRALGVTGNQDSIDYQTQITGVELQPDGKRPEFASVDPGSGRIVDYDGHVYRNNGDEVFLEAKDGYSELSTDPNSDWSIDARRKLIRQARRQIAALPPGAKLEWHVSDPLGTAAIRRILSASEFRRIEIIDTPAI